MSDTKYLFQRGEIWWMSKSIPASLRQVMGMDRLRTSLHTSDLKLARHHRNIILTDLEQASSDASGGFLRRYLLALRVAQEKTQDSIQGFLDAKQLDIDIAREQGVEDFTKVAGFIDYAAHLEASGKPRDPVFGYTLETCLEEWQQSTYAKGLADKTLYNYKQSVQEFGPDKVLSDVRRSEVVEFVDQLKDRVGYSRRVHILAALSTLWQYGWDRDRFEANEANPFKGIKHGSKSDQSRYEYIDDEQLAAVLNRMKPVDHLPALACRLMGLRISEVWLAEYVVIDNVECVRTGVKTKAGKNRIVPIHPLIRNDLVAALRGERKFAFSDDAENPSDTYSKKFGRLKKALGYPRTISCHSCRVAFITDAKNNLKSTTGDLDTNTKVAWVAGHELGRSTQTDHYHRGYPVEVLQEVVNSVSFDLGLLTFRE